MVMSKPKKYRPSPMLELKRMYDYAQPLLKTKKWSNLCFAHSPIENARVKTAND